MDASVLCWTHSYMTIHIPQGCCRGLGLIVPLAISCMLFFQRCFLELFDVVFGYTHDFYRLETNQSFVGGFKNAVFQQTTLIVAKMMTGLDNLHLKFKYSFIYLESSPMFCTMTPNITYCSLIRTEGLTLIGYKYSPDNKVKIKWQNFFCCSCLSCVCVTVAQEAEQVIY